MMKFPINSRAFITACLLSAGLTLSACNTQVTESPKSLQVVLSENNSIYLSWDAVDEATAYRIYRKKSGSPDFKFVTDTETPYYTDIPSTVDLYDYKVTALGPYGESDGTVHLAADIPTEPMNMSQPIITSVTRLDIATNVLFFSDENTDCQYEILRQDNFGEWKTVGMTADLVYYDKTAPKYGYYSYRIRAVKTDGESPISKEVAENTARKAVFGVPVLMYHEFVTQQDLDSGVAFDEYAIYYHEFEQDLQWLRDNGYTTITTSEFAQYLNGQGEMPEKPVLLTIDDGKLGVYKNAYPLLQKYNMKAVLAVIGTEILAASEAPELRAENPAPYCTWTELAEMSDSGHIEIASHTYGFHIYQHEGRKGADIGEADDISDFKMDAFKDFQTLQTHLKNADIPKATTLAYPYSARSVTADEVWRQCGYQVLLGGNMESARPSRINYFIREAGLNENSSVLRRIARMHGTPIEDYIG